ncbi:hypothetical protein HYS79_02365 [Patescibacteria group bacterium]|nr:hypothetical protein [Patescibacteria group bacterium]
MTLRARGYSVILVILAAAFVAVLGIVAWQQGGLGTIAFPAVPTVPEETPTPTDDTSGSIAPYQSGVRGVVLLGPTCPVAQNPPQPGCDDRPYATAVKISRAGDPAHAFAQTESTETGEFEVALPPGDYLVIAGPGTVSLPRCTTQPVTVPAYGYVGVAINCDSGIR